MLLFLPIRLFVPEVILLPYSRAVSLVLFTVRTNNNTAIGLAASGTGDLPTFTAANSGSTPIVGSITVTPEYDNGAGVICYGNAQTFTITVNPTPTVVSATTKTICNNTNVSYTPVSSVSSSTFNWTATNTVGTVTGFTASGSGPIGDVLNNTGVSNGVVRYVITPTGPAPSNCPGAAFNFDVTVNPSPNVSASNNTICSRNPAGITLNTTVTGTTFYYAAPVISNAAGNITGGVARPTPGSSSVISDVLVNTTAIDQTATYTVYPTKDGCVGTPITVIVTVKPEPTAPNATVTTCSDVALNYDLFSSVTRLQTGVTFTYTVASSNQASVPAGANRVGATSSNITDTYVNTTNASVTITYTVTPIASNGCSGQTFTVTATINPKPAITNQTTSTCSHSALNYSLQNLLPAGAMRTGSTFTYTVASSDPGNVPAGPDRVAASGSNITNNYTNTTASAVTITYTVTPTSGQGCTGSTFTVTATINPEPVVANQTPAAICSRTASGVTLNASTSVAAATYNITTINANGLTASAGSPATGTGFASNVIANDAWINTTTAQVNVVYTVVPVSGAGCTGSSFTVTLPVNPEPVLTSGLVQTLCADGSFNATASRTLSISPVLAGTTTYSWGAPTLTGTMSYTNNGTSGSSIIDNFHNTESVARTATYSVTPTADAALGGCSGQPVNVVITVNPRPLINSSLTGSVCSGSTYSYTITSNVASSTFAWSRASVPNINGGATGSGATSSISEILTNSTGSDINVTYVLTPTGPSSCAGTPSNLVVTVRALPAVSNQTPAAICSRTASGVTLGSSTNATAVATYNITNINANGLTASAGSPATGTGFASNVIANDAWINTTVAQVNVVYTVVPVTY